MTDTAHDHLRPAAPDAQHDDLAPGTRSAARTWASRILFIVPVLFLAMDGVMKFMLPAVVVDTSAKLGITRDVLPVLGAVLLVSLALYMIPRTAVLGAVLLTGYLGGAVATHVRVGSPLLSAVLFPVYVGAMLWGALYLRDERVARVMPIVR